MGMRRFCFGEGCFLGCNILSFSCPSPTQTPTKQVPRLLFYCLSFRDPLFFYLYSVSRFWFDVFLHFFVSFLLAGWFSFRYNPLFVSRFVCLSICLSVCLFVCGFVCLFVCLSLALPVEHLRLSLPLIWAQWLAHRRFSKTKIRSTNSLLSRRERN